MPPKPRYATDEIHEKPRGSGGNGPPISSVASFLVLGGGGGQDPEMYRQKIYVLILRERAKQPSASETYIFRTPNTSAYIQSMQFPLITYGMAL